MQKPGAYCLGGAGIRRVLNRDTRKQERSRMKTSVALRRLFGAGGLGALAATAAAQTTGPSSSQSPYVLPTIPGVSTTSILTVGDNVGGYRMVGIPDGLGAFGQGAGSPFTLMMN